MNPWGKRMNDRPLIAITIGDPGGVGPEVVLKAVARPAVQGTCRPLILGDAVLLEHAASSMNLHPELHCISDLSELKGMPSGVAILNLPGLDLDAFQPGEIRADFGRASLSYIELAIDLALTGQVAGIATGPIHKAALHLAGSPFRGHTGLLADRCGVSDVSIMLLSPGRAPQPHWLRVTHATTHIALKEVPSRLTHASLLSTVRLTHSGLVSLAIGRERIAIAGLNPHAGDEGLMGDEEIRLIQPAVEQARAEGFDVQGPLPADTVFLRAVQGEFDAVVALYHDQGHIPVKLHGFENAVNLTLGLPIIRTSVDHGTAFDIAWQGIANETSMVAAIELAAALARNKTHTR
jgi:4-hydroxythreonine-4-phosphate dehydrogenase